MTPSIRKLAAWIALAVVSVTFAGCDKCGNRVRINTPSIQHACGDDVQQAK